MAADLEHRPTDDTADGRERCEADGYLWPCPEVRHRPEALLPGGDIIVNEVGIGWALWSRTHRHAGSDVPVGGIVVSVREEDPPGDSVDEPDHRPSDVVRVFRVLNFGRDGAQFDELRVGDFDPMLSNPPNSVSIRGYARRLAGVVAKSKGTVSPHELELAEIAARLLRSIA